MLDEDTSTGTELTVSARRSIAFARDAARRLGHERIDSADLLLGLMAEKDGIAAAALADLGVRIAGVTAAIAASALINPPHDDTERYFADDLAAALNAAARHSLRDDRGVTTGHLLLGVVSTKSGSGALALSALGITAAMVEAAVPRVTAARPEGSSLSDAVARAELPHEAPLPGRFAVALGVGATVTIAAGLGAVIALSTPTLEDAVVVGAAMVVCAGAQFLAVGAVLLVAPLVAARRFARQRPLVAPPYLVDLLRRHGIRRLSLLAQTGGGRRNRCLRLGRRAWLVLAPATIRRPRALAFAIGHEVAHLARNDSLRRRVDLTLGLSLLYGAGFAGNPAAWALAVSGAGLLWLVPRWTAELAADTIALQWAGREAMRDWAAAVPPARRAHRLAGLLTHPPLPLRLRRAARA
jgi:hypothetical protein